MQTGKIKLITALLLLASIPLAGLPLVRNDGPQRADAIIVIGGDHKPARVKRAVQLYQNGYAPIVILSAGTEVAEGVERVAEAEVMRRQAVAYGLPESALLVEDQSQSTFQNAYYTKTIGLERGFKAVLLVASVYHSQRAGRIFNDVYGSDISVQVQPAPPDACSLCWWFQPDQAGVVFYEYYSWVRYWLGRRLSAKARKKGASEEFLT